MLINIGRSSPGIVGGESPRRWSCERAVGVGFPCDSAVVLADVLVLNDGVCGNIYGDWANISTRFRAGNPVRLTAPGGVVGGGQQERIVW